MKKLRSQFGVVAVLVAVALTAGCIHKAGGAKVTPYEKAVTYSASLAQVNSSVADGIMTAHRQGVVSSQQANAVLTFQAKIADDHERLSQILGEGPQSASGSAAEILRLIDDVKAQANALIAGGGLNITNPNTQQSFAADVNSVAAFADMVVASLKAAGVLQ